MLPIFNRSNDSIVMTLFRDEMDSSDVTVWEVVSDYLPGRSVAVTSACSTEIQQHYNKECIWSKALLERYPFATPEKLLQWKIEYDADALKTKPHKETYVAIERSIDTWASEFYNKYATCNPKYVRKDLMIKDVADVLKQLLCFRFGILPALFGLEQWDDSCCHRVAHEMIAIISGVTDDVVIVCDDRGKRSYEVTTGITDFLSKFNV